jgi:hypothetical protein
MTPMRGARSRVILRVSSSTTANDDHRRIPMIARLMRGYVRDGELFKDHAGTGLL